MGRRPHCEGIVVEHDGECCQWVRQPHCEGIVVGHDRECCQWVRRPHCEGIVVEHDRECCQWVDDHTVKVKLLSMIENVVSGSTTTL